MDIFDAPLAGSTVIIVYLFREVTTAVYIALGFYNVSRDARENSAINFIVFFSHSVLTAYRSTSSSSVVNERRSQKMRSAGNMCRQQASFVANETINLGPLL